MLSYRKLERKSDKDLIEGFETILIRGKTTQYPNAHDKDKRGYAMIYKGTVELKTERLILRRFTLDDAKDVFQRWCGSAENSKFVMKSPHSSVIETKEMLQVYIRD